VKALARSALVVAAALVLAVLFLVLSIAVFIYAG
jgi:hypothetical protein